MRWKLGIAIGLLTGALTAVLLALGEEVAKVQAYSPWTRRGR